ncbi:hypothetical protein EDB89DRAFT_1909823 [Lactarius sanguifluus]|nr:hypothetical protein EDB89DRAFT_1909823 [Lactarius sanguifluus]
MFASSRHLRLDLLCTHGIPVKKQLLGYLATFPIVISFRRPYLRGSDEDNLSAALEHHNRVRVFELKLPYTLFKELATVMQEPFPALTHFWFEWDNWDAMPPLPDTFLGGSAPCLQTIHISGIPFPAAPTLLSSAHGLVDLDLCNIPPAGYIPPEAMVASLSALPKLKYLTLEFKLGMSYSGSDRMRLPPITPNVLPSLTRFCFKGLFKYFEDLVAQIDAPLLDGLRIEYLEQEVTALRVPQLCKFFDRSENFKSSQFYRADLLVKPDTVVVNFRRVQLNQLSLSLSVQRDAIGQVVSQISAMHSDVSRLSITSEFDELGDGDDIQWLELFRPFTSVKELTVGKELSFRLPLVLNNITGEMAAEVLPALELLWLANQPSASVGKFVAARRNMGLFLTVIDDGEEEEVA